MGRAEALEGGSPAQAACLFGAAAQAPAKQFGGAGDPGALEGVDGDAGGIAEDGVVESELFGADVIKPGWLACGEGEADGTHALFGEMFVSLQYAGAIGEFPPEEGEVDGGAVVTIDAGGGAGGAVEGGQGPGDDFGEEGEGRWGGDARRQDAREEVEDDGSWMVDCRASREGGAGFSSLALTSDLCLPAPGR